MDRDPPPGAMNAEIFPPLAQAPSSPVVVFPHHFADRPIGPTFPPSSSIPLVQVRSSSAELCEASTRIPAR